MDHYRTLEFDKILEMLAEHALSEAVRDRCRGLTPSLSEAEVNRRMRETTQARRMIEQTGTPPLSRMAELHRVIGLITIDSLLTPEQIIQVEAFITACRRMKAYLKRAESASPEIASYGGSILELAELSGEIGRCIVNGVVDDRATPKLYDLRRRTAAAADQIRAKLDALLRKNQSWFSEGFVSVRNGHYTLPVKREHRNQITGTVIELSNTGGTCFMEPASVGRLQSELSVLQIEEENEVRRVLYELTALIADQLPAIRLNIEAMETLDFLFAKGKLSLAMKAGPVGINTEGRITIANARHPLLDPAAAVPLNLTAGGGVTGVVITGPNTGGKTVALKTVGLLSLMAQCGLHVPADGSSSFCMHSHVLCDIGDGQSITENLSTFSSHIKNILEILRTADRESLVLLDELGSGTDPAEGMGLAVAILDELCAKGCLFVVTTHYPEIKEYAAAKPGLINARMAFDRESLLPLYRLEVGEAGESCAIFIARRLGMPERMLARAHEAAYRTERAHEPLRPVDAAVPAVPGASPRIRRRKEPAPAANTHRERFGIGDSVLVYPGRETGIVYARADEKGEVGVQIKGIKRLVNHKRLKLRVAAKELYPEDYDFSIVFDSVENRKARHIMGKRHEEGLVAVIKEGEKEQ